MPGRLMSMSTTSGGWRGISFSAVSAFGVVSGEFEVRRAADERGEAGADAFVVIHNGNFDLHILGNAGNHTAFNTLIAANSQLHECAAQLALAPFYRSSGPANPPKVSPSFPCRRRSAIPIPRRWPRRDDACSPARSGGLPTTMTDQSPCHRPAPGFPACRRKSSRWT